MNQEAWLKPHIDLHTELRKNWKNDFKKDLLKLMNNVVFGKTIENMRKHRDIKNELFDVKIKVSHDNFFSKDLLVIEINKAQIITNNSVYLG